MGKPSSSQLSRKSSNQSLNTTMSKEKNAASLSSNKLTLLKKKRRAKTTKSIQKLFNQLRNDSETSIIEIDDTNTTVLHKDSMIIIPDDDDNEPKSSKTITPRKNVYCLPSHSTPNPKSQLTITEMINNNNNTIKPMNIVNDTIHPSKAFIDIMRPVTIMDDHFYNRSILQSAKTVKTEIENLTREINQDSYLTIDLTADSSIRTQNQTVIDLESMVEDGEIVSNASTMSGDSDVTVINMNNNGSKRKEMRKIAKGIANLNPSDKGKLLEMITKTIFSGCTVPTELKNSLSNVRQSMAKATETSEDQYIKQVILNESRNSVGSNIYNPDKPQIKSALRMIVIDGSNVAMEHGRGKFFSVKGLKICIDYFLKRGHVVKAFVPRFRCKFGKSSDPRLLDHLERQGWVVYTPSREVQGKTITPYDDRYIVQCAAEFEGIIVSGDNYRDLIHENARWRHVIESRLLPFTWVNDMIMFPRDPLGRTGPSLEVFLRNPNVPKQS